MTAAATQAVRDTGTRRWAAMPPLHRANLFAHIGTGSIAILIGLGVLVRAKGTARHRRHGRWFVAATAVVVVSAVTGMITFRTLPIFAALSLLVGYQLFGGWRAARTQAAGPGLLDAGATLLAGALAIRLAMPLLAGRPDVMAVSALAALSLVLAWDTLRWWFPRRWFAVLWRYEHGYKLLAALFGMVSALVGNVVRVGQPWSQLIPVVLGLLVIAVMLVRMRRRELRTATVAVSIEHI